MRAARDSGEVVEDYPDDKPYPSRPVLGRSGDTPHVVVAEDASD